MGARQGRDHDDPSATREAHPHDGHAVLVTPTARGEREITSLAESYDGLATRLFADLHPVELSHLVAGLDHVVGELRAAVEETAPSG